MYSARMRPAAAAIVMVLLLGGCGSMPSVDIWPFKKESQPVASTSTVSAPVAAAETAAAPRSAPVPAPAPAQVAIPVVASAYACEGGRRIQLRPLEGGAVWLTLPEREVRLEKSPAALNRYTAGRVTLDIGDKSATVLDGPVNYVGCKASAPAS